MIHKAGLTAFQTGRKGAWVQVVNTQCYIQSSREDPVQVSFSGGNGEKEKCLPLKVVGKDVIWAILVCVWGSMGVLTNVPR